MTTRGGVWSGLLTGLLLALAMLFSARDGGAADAPLPLPESVRRSSPGRVFQIGEELEYKVSYSFFTIGTIRIVLTDTVERGGRTVYQASAYIDSNPSLSWLVDLHVRFTSEIDQDVFSYQWIGDDSTSKGVSFRRLAFDYDNSIALYDKGVLTLSGERIVESTDTVVITDRCQDGLSLFFYAREHVRQRKGVHVPTVIEDKQVSTFINFMNKRTDAVVDAIGYPVEVLEFDGRADYVGVFGLTGGFQGWFSDDDARVPILARMKVILGSIKIQLMRWNRPGWQPPRLSERGAR